MQIPNGKLEYILSLPFLSEFLPHKFRNGTIVNNGFFVNCKCGQKIEMSSIHAKVDAYTHSLAVRAYALCNNCKTIDEINTRIASDGTRVIQDENGVWKQLSFQNEKNRNWLTRIKSIFIQKRF